MEVEEAQSECWTDPEMEVPDPDIMELVIKEGMRHQGMEVPNKSTVMRPETELVHKEWLVFTMTCS